jgi:ankyrin repeat protein
MLIEHGADVNALTDEGQSPLIMAAAKDHKDMIALLEEHGASTQHAWMGLRAEDVKPRDRDGSDVSSAFSRSEKTQPSVYGSQQSTDWQSSSSSLPSGSKNRSSGGTDLQSSFVSSQDTETSTEWGSSSRSSSSSSSSIFQSTERSTKKQFSSTPDLEQSKRMSVVTEVPGAENSTQSVEAQVEARMESEVSSVSSL